MACRCLFPRSIPSGSVPEGLAVGRSQFFIDAAAIEPTFTQVHTSPADKTDELRGSGHAEPDVLYVQMACVDVDDMGVGDSSLILVENTYCRARPYSSSPLRYFLMVVEFPSKSCGCQPNTSLMARYLRAEHHIIIHEGFAVQICSKSRQLRSLLSTTWPS